MCSNGLGTSLLVYVVLPTFPGPSNSNLKKKERLRPMKLGRAQIQTIVAESRIHRALQSKLPHATEYLIIPGNLVRVFRDRLGRWEAPFTVVRIGKKIVSITDGTNVEPFNISTALAITPKTNDSDLKSYMKITQAFVIQNAQTQPMREY